MPRIPIVTIKKIRTILKSELPLNAPLGRPIITSDTSEMFIGTGETTPLIRIEELMTLDKVSDLTLDKGSTQKLYLVKETNEYSYFFNSNFIKINGVGILNTVTKYSDLPINNEIEGLFTVSIDETNNSLPTIYFYNKSSNTYNRLSFTNFNNTFVGLNVDDVDLIATGSNNTLSINSGNLMNLETDVVNKQIMISQKAGINVEFEMKTYTMNSGIKSPLPVAMDGLNCTVANGKIYCFGGRPQSNGIPTNTIYTYDEINGWKNIGVTTPFNKGFMSINTYNEKIYLAGGYYVSGGLYYSYNNFYEFDPITNTFTEKAPMNQKRHTSYSAVIGDKLWIISGVYYTSTSNTTYADAKSIEYYDFGTDTWTLLGTSYNMPTSTYSGASFVIDSKIHCIGGYNKATTTYQNLHQVFDTETLTWETKAVYPYSYVGQRGISVNGLGYVMGGYPDGYSNSKSTYVYVPKFDKWIRRDDMSIARTNFSVVFYNNSIYAISGAYYWNNSGTSTYTRTAVVEAYTPIYDTELKDYQVILRYPQKIGATANISNLLHNETSELNRNLTLEADKYWEYGDWQTKGNVEVLVKKYNY